PPLPSTTLFRSELADDPHVLARRPASRGGARGIGADDDETRVVESGRRLHQVVDALVGARRAEKHHDARVADAEARARGRPVEALRGPRLGDADLGPQEAPD